MSGPGLRQLNFGTIPTREYCGILVRFEGLPLGFSSADDLHRELVRLRDRGDMAALRVLLLRVGCCWPDPAAETLKARAS